MDYMNELQKNKFISLTVVVFITFLLSLILYLTQKYLVQKLGEVAKKTSTIWDDIMVEMIKSIKKYFIISVCLYSTVFFVDLEDSIREFIDKSFTVIVFVQVAQISSYVLNKWVSEYLKHHLSNDPVGASTAGLISVFLKTVVYSTIVLLVLNNLGVNISALIAGLGVGGVAVALALQNILTDLFSSLTIILDKPFVVGDFIVLGELSGTVEHIGLKTTRIRSLSGEQIIFGNGDLLQSRIRNYKRMKERRIVQSLTVTYFTQESILEQIPRFLKEIVDSQSLTRFDRCHFLRFLDSSLEFELVYWVLSADYIDYADCAQAINLAIFKKFKESNIDFAFPTQTVFIAKN